MTIKLYQCDKNKNVGDTLTQPIIESILDTKTVKVTSKTKGKLLGIGSIISWAAQHSDTIWGSGIISDKPYILPQCKILALRGKLTASLLKQKCEILSDPGILLPLIYNPIVEKKYKLGIVEHYVDKGLYIGDGHRINITHNWKFFVNEIKSCEFILSSSLHGLILSEAYNIPCDKIKLSDNIIGGDFKFKDYLTASNRKNFGVFEDIEIYQKLLVGVLNNYYVHNIQ